MSHLESLPQEILTDELLPLLPLKDLLSLFQVSKFFAGIGRDEVFWKRRLQQDFNFTNASNARSSGFKFLYSRLNDPKVFVWGENSDERLGRPISPSRGRATGSRQFWPLELSIPGSRIVELVAGGWSFTAIDTKGNVWVWGRLEGAYGLNVDSFIKSTKPAKKPLRLNLPTPMRSISCGRALAIGLDYEGKVWCFYSWGLPFVYSPSLFEQTYQGSEIIQVECGWSFFAALTASGMAVVWNQHGQVGAAYDQKDEVWDDQEREEAKAIEVDGVIQCQTWTVQGIEPLVLPELPNLPSLKTGQVGNYRLVKIAGGDQFILGLTNGGHVLKLDLNDINDPDALEDLATAFQQRTRGWQYLPMYCERSKIAELDTFKKGSGLALPEELEITHISAHFLTFVAYTTGPNSIVLTGTNDATPTSNPTVIPSLQNRGVISIVLGDYHWGALLDNGKLLTWGAACSTGLGDPFEIDPGKPGGFRNQQERNRGLTTVQSIPDVTEPTEVRFDHDLVERRNMFVFAAAASGWHMGALVIDLDEGEAKVKEREDPKPTEPPLLPPQHGGIRGPNGHMMPPFLFRGALMGGPQPPSGTSS
ncbi:RCC1/BLIP-II protein [Serendipita vermifera]|nr:RCC1/BLIP-II protein [Serendipita vermifera]